MNVDKSGIFSKRTNVIVKGATNGSSIKTYRTTFYLNRGVNQNTMPDIDLPLLIPVVSDGDYNISRRIVSNLYAKEGRYRPYHVWLDCLYQDDVTFQDIKKELEILLGPRECFSADNLFLVGYRRSDGTTQTAGSCFILLREGGLLNFNLDQKILDIGMHMSKVDFSHIRYLLKSEPILIFRHAYKELVDGIPVVALLRACKKSFPDFFKQQDELNDSLTTSPKKSLPSSRETNGVVHHNSLNLTSSETPPVVVSEPKLVQLTPRMSDDILKRTLSKEYAYLQFRITGLQKFDLNLLHFLFSPCKCDWRDLFLSGSSGGGRSGVVVISSEDAHWFSTAKAARQFNYRGNTINATIYLIDCGLFQSVVKNCNQTKIYDVKHVVRESPSLKVSLPQSSNHDTIEKVTNENHVPIKENGIDYIEIDSNSDNSEAGSSFDRLVIDVQQSPKTMNLDNEEPDCFVPLTIETISFAINILNRFSNEGRLVFVIFDSCFTKPNLSIEEIRTNFSSMFEWIDVDCIMIRSNLNKLMPDIKMACEKQFDCLPRAFIVSREGADRADLVSKSNQNMILCGLVTFKCVIENLKSATFLMSRNALLKAGAQVDSVTRPFETELSEEKKGKRLKLSLEALSNNVNEDSLPIFI